MSPPEIKGAVRAIAAAVAFGALLAGCSSSDLYLDRRETIALGADDAVAANMAEETIDPWPRHSNNNNLAFNGERMQRAIECYRKNKVTKPADIDSTSDSANAAPAAGDACVGAMSAGSAQLTSGAPVAGGAATH